MSHITLKQGQTFKAGKVTNAIFRESDLTVVEFNPIIKSTGDPVFSMYVNADSLPFVQLLKKESTAKHAARYLTAVVSNGVHKAEVSLVDIGAIAGVSQADRDVLGELMETVISMMCTSSVTRPQINNGFKIEPCNISLIE